MKNEIKRLSVTIDQWIINHYLKEYDNISARIRQLIIIGTENEINNPNVTINKLVEIKAENEKLTHEIKKLRNELETKKKDENKLKLNNNIIQCDHCNNYYDKNDLIHINDKKLCKDCASQQHTR
jgi:formylmethanofuran dehydrogenase subunit E